jgi:hypothetical protein
MTRIGIDIFISNYLCTTPFATIIAHTIFILQENTYRYSDTDDLLCNYQQKDSFRCKRHFKIYIKEFVLAGYTTLPTQTRRPKRFFIDHFLLVMIE